MQTSRLLKILTTSAFIGTIAVPAAHAAAPATTTADGFVRAQSLSGAYLAAKSAQLDGDMKKATDFYRQALVIDPTSDLLQQDAMFAFLAEGQIKDGIDLAAKLRDDPDAGKVARIALGVDAIKKGDFSAATAQFDIVDPSDLDALLLGELTAWAEIGAGDVDEALHRLDAINGAPWYGIFNGYQKGLMATVAGRTDVARTAFDKVIADEASARTSPDAYLASAEALARLEMRDGHKDAAIKALDAGLKLAATYDPLQSLKQRIEKGETIEPAVSNVQEGASEALYVLGQAVNRGDGQQVALLYFQLARSLAPRSPALLTAMAGISERAKRLDQAIDYYRQIPENSAYRRTADLQIGLDLWYSDKKDEAKTHLEDSIKQYPKDVQSYTAFADVLAADKEFGKAAEQLNTAISLSKPAGPSDWNLYYQRGIAFERTKQWAKAEPDFKKALELSPNQPQVLNYLGYSWVDRNENLKEGLQMIKSAVDLRPNDGYIIDSLGWAYYRLGQYDQAVEQLERAVLITPMDPTINDHLGDAYWHVGRKREARFQWQRSLIGDPKPEPELVKTVNAKLENGLQPSTESDAPQKADASKDGIGKRQSTADASSGASQAPASVDGGTKAAPSKDETKPAGATAD